MAVNPVVTGALTIVSCVASMIGSVAIVLTFAMLREFRSYGRAILVFLAIADFCTAFGYLFGASLSLYYNYTTNYNPNDVDSGYLQACMAQSFLTSFFPISSFLWTLNLAIYLLVVVVYNKQGWKLFIAFHLSAWGIPLVVCTIAVALKAFGPNRSLTSADWCFISGYANITTNTDGSLKWTFYFFEAMCGKFWEISTYIACIVLYVVIKCHIKKTLTNIQTLPQAKYWSLTFISRWMAAANQFDSKLIYIPMIFVLFRIWGTIRYFMSFSCEGICPPALDDVLIVLQSMFDPAQGWGNALLFVVFDKPVIKRVCPCAITACQRLLNCFWCKKDGVQAPLLGNQKKYNKDSNEGSVNS